MEIEIKQVVSEGSSNCLLRVQLAHGGEARRQTTSCHGSTPDQSSMTVLRTIVKGGAEFSCGGQMIPIDRFLMLYDIHFVPTTKKTIFKDDFDANKHTLLAHRAWQKTQPSKTAFSQKNLKSRTKKNRQNLRIYF